MVTGIFLPESGSLSCTIPTSIGTRSGQSSSSIWDRGATARRRRVTRLRPAAGMRGSAPLRTLYASAHARCPRSSRRCAAAYAQRESRGLVAVGAARGLSGSRPAGRSVTVRFASLGDVQGRAIASLWCCEVLGCLSAVWLSDLLRGVGWGCDPADERGFLPFVPWEGDGYGALRPWLGAGGGPACLRDGTHCWGGGGAAVLRAALGGRRGCCRAFVRGFISCLTFQREILRRVAVHRHPIKVS